MISEEKLQSRLEDCSTAYEKYETAVIELLEGGNIKPAKLATLKEKLKYRLKVLDETIKLYCR